MADEVTPCAPVAAHLQPRTEEEVAAACDDFMARAGFEVEKYEQGRRTRITEGLPDRRYVHRTKGYRVWVELKAPTGQLTRAQHVWLRAEQAAAALALAVDDREQLRHLVNLLPKLYGHADALRYAAQVTALIAARGYRGEPKPPRPRSARTARQRTRRA